MQKKKFMFEEVLKKMQKYCLYQERCHYEVEQKLYEFSLTTQEKEELLIALIHDNFLNEERFCRSFIRGKFYQKNWGKIKIESELLQRKIPKKLLLSCMDEIDINDYREVLKKLYQKKYKLLTDRLSSTKKQKVFRYLLMKGYESEEIQRYIHQE